jgi:hypothetical protein
MQEKEKFEYRQATYKIRRQVFCPTIRSSQESEGFFSDKLHTRAHMGKPLSPPGLVCRQKKKKGAREKEKKRKEEDQGRWSVATRRGRNKEEKKKTKEGEKAAPAKARFRVPSTKNFFIGS